MADQFYIQNDPEGRPQKGLYVVGEAGEALFIPARLAHSAPELLKAAISAIRTVRCIGTNENNDTCGVTFTCQNCRAVSGLVSAVEKAEGLDDG